MLQRHVDVWSHLARRRHRFDDAVAHRRRIQVQQSNPAQRFDCVEALDQSDESVAQADIAPVIGRILRNDDRLADAACNERLCFGCKRLHRAALADPAQRRDDAKRARVIAAFRHLEIGRRTGGRYQARQKTVSLDIFVAIFEMQRPRARPRFVDDFSNFREGAGAHDGIDFRHELAQLRAVALRQATRDDEQLTAPLALRVLQDDVGRLFFGGIDERAGVDDDRLGVAGIGREGPAVRRESAQHDFAVDEIFCAA